MLAHVSIGVRDVDTSRAFYDAEEVGHERDYEGLRDRLIATP
jgi:catechol 2,3-dioxygenase-like lactoylglutathione lyase family enzyme